MNIWFLLYVIILISEIGRGTHDEDLNITQILNKYGYPMEIHEIVTDDEYILDLYRIPHGRRRTKTKKYPVLLTHGLLATSEIFIFLGPKKGLAYLLADNGYDVWLINTRGSWHSRKHKTLNPDNDRKYWQFTFNELGTFDLPATIDYVLNKTNSNKVHFVGQSQGCTAFFVMCSERPEYNNYVKVMIAEAPGVFFNHFKHTIFRTLAGFYRLIERLMDEAEIYEMLPFISNKNFHFIANLLCGKNGILPLEICRIILFLIFEDKEMDMNVLPLAMSKLPAGASIKQAFHYAQLVQSGKFQKYDWSPEENMRRYNSRVPPEYNLKNVTTPVAIFYGEDDTLVSEEDIYTLAQHLPNMIEMHKVDSRNWNHYDFMWGKNVDILVNRIIVDIITKYDNK